MESTGAENWQSERSVDMISLSQIKQIHTLKSILGLDEELYQEMLMSFGVTTCKNLTFTEAGILLEILTSKAVAAGKWQRQNKKYADFELRDKDMATPAQMRKIEIMWAGLCYEKTTENIQKTLRKFISKHFKVSDIRFIDKFTATKIIHVIDKIKIEKFNKELKAF